MIKQSNRDLFLIVECFLLLAIYVLLGILVAPNAYADVTELSKAEAVESALDSAEYCMKSKNLAENVYKKGHRSSISNFFRNLFSGEKSKNRDDGSSLRLDIGLSVGYRTDDLKWSIAYDRSGTLTPNILSELTWSDIKSRQIRTDGTLYFDNNFLLEGYFAYGDVYSGDNQDSDYSGDNRTLEFSRSNNNGSEGDMYDASGALGFKFNLEEAEKYVKIQDLSLTFLGGYSYHQQYLVMTDGYQTIPVSYKGPFAGLHSFYEAEWKGPWMGFKLSGAYKSLSSFFRFEYHIADYYGHADWNLRDDLSHPKSYEHIADGSGVVLNLGCAYDLTNNWSVGLNMDWQDWETGSGIDRTFFSDGTSSETRLNGVKWDSYAFRLGAKYSF